MINSNNAISLKNSKDKSMKTLVNFQYVKCNRCNFLIGLFLKENYYFIKSMIKARKSKEFFLELISIKSELLKEFKSNLDSIFKNNIVNVIFIIHKIEGRIFLLGKNGYYNNVIQTLKKRFTNNIFFILLVNEKNNIKNKKMIEDLIEKGGEEDLKSFYNNNRIIFINNYNYKQEILKLREFWINIIHNNYSIISKFNEFFENESLDAYTNDKIIIDKMANYLINKEDNFINRCFN